MTKTKAQMSEQQEQEQNEDAIVEQVGQACSIGRAIFGDKCTATFTLWVNEYLDIAEVDDLVADLRRTYEKAKVAFLTVAPTPDEVIGLFELFYPPEEE